MSVAVILLAAGGSSRLGRPKQLLPYGEGSTLLRHAVNTALASDCSPIVVVLGSNADACREALVGLPVDVVINEKWELGIGSSISAGAAVLTAGGASEPGAAIIMLCDQPWVTAEHLAHLMAAFSSGVAEAVATEYAGTAGVPALFARSLFPELISLDAAHGAKQLIVRLGERVARVQFDNAAMDIDTQDDYERLMRTRSLKPPSEDRKLPE